MADIVEAPDCAVSNCPIPAFYQADNGDMLCPKHARVQGVTNRVLSPVLRF